MGKPTAWCKDCLCCVRRQYYLAHREQLLQSNKRWRRSHPDKWKRSIRRARLKIQFGISLEDYNAVLRLQGGKCAICRIEPMPGERRLHIDHDHNNGSFRGLLCGRCNSTLERMESIENWEIHARAYLQKPSYVYGCRGPCRFTELSYENEVSKEMIN